MMDNDLAAPNTQVYDRANQRNALAAGFLGWTLDAFDFFVLTFVLVPVARDFGVSMVADRGHDHGQPGHASGGRVYLRTDGGPLWTPLAADA